MPRFKIFWRVEVFSKCVTWCSPYTHTTLVIPLSVGIQILSWASLHVADFVEIHRIRLCRLITWKCGWSVATERLFEALFTTLIIQVQYAGKHNIWKFASFHSDSTKAWLSAISDAGCREMGHCFKKQSKPHMSGVHVEAVHSGGNHCPNQADNQEYTEDQKARVITL